MFVKGFNRELGEDEVRNQLMEAFKECGEISAVRLPTNRETGDLKGIGFVEFATSDGKVMLHPIVFIMSWLSLVPGS